jgi:hypothetical protein
MLDDILLEEHQRELLHRLVEAEQAVPRDKRREFFLTPTFGAGTELHHPGLPGGKLSAYHGDLDSLENEGLIRYSRRSGSVTAIDITPRGLEYYRQIRAEIGDPIRRVESAMLELLRSADFRSRHPLAYDKWAAAEARLLAAPTDQDLTVIGHLCREAIQAFVTGLVERHGATEAPENLKSTKSRLRAVLKKVVGVGDTERELLDALAAYWDAVNGLVQRQEHGAEREKEKLTAEDGRRVVFQACVLMYEVDRTLARAGSRA